MQKYLLLIPFLVMQFMASSQNVGIGTNSPEFKLDVNGRINADSQYCLNSYPVFSTSGTNLFLGIAAGNETTGSSNTFCGHLSGSGNTSGSSNSFFGALAGVYSTGSRNSFFGRNTAVYNDSNDNSIFGYYAGSSNTTGFSNSFFGSSAGIDNTEGFENSFFGHAAGYSNTVGDYNAFFGKSAGGFTTTGFDNSFFGVSAGLTNVDGTRNTAIGFTADVMSASLTNATAIGHNAKVDANDKVRVGDGFVNSIGGQVGWSTFSDGRYKNDVQENIPGLSFISKLRPVSYQVDHISLNQHYNPGNITTDKSLSLGHNSIRQYSEEDRQTGFVAQEVEQSAKDLGFPFSGVDKPQNGDALYGLRYGDFVVPLVKAVQEQQVMIEKQSDMIDELKTTVEFLMKEIAELKKK